MNLRFLGDSLDHWKGSVLQHLSGEGALQDLRVNAMASDLEDWETPDWAVYFRLMRVIPIQVVGHQVPLSGNRHRYFAEIPPSGDLFLDPDTGIATGKANVQHLKPEERAPLLSVLMVPGLALPTFAGRHKYAEVPLHRHGTSGALLLRPMARRPGRGHESS